MAIRDDNNKKKSANHSGRGRCLGRPSRAATGRCELSLEPTRRVVRGGRRQAAVETVGLRPRPPRIAVVQALISSLDRLRTGSRPGASSPVGSVARQAQGGFWEAVRCFGFSVSDRDMDMGYY
jgi:hypothetical protein